MQPDKDPGRILSEREWPSGDPGPIHSELQMQGGWPLPRNPDEPQGWGEIVVLWTGCVVLGAILGAGVSLL